MGTPELRCVLVLYGENIEFLSCGFITFLMNIFTRKMGIIIALRLRVCAALTQHTTLILLRAEEITEKHLLHNFTATVGVLIIIYSVFIYF